MEKLTFGLVTASRKLRHYFQTYVINVLIDHPLKKSMNKLEATRRLIQWAIELDFSYKYFMIRVNNVTLFPIKSFFLNWIFMWLKKSLEPMFNMDKIGDNLVKIHLQLYLKHYLQNRITLPITHDFKTTLLIKK